MAKQRPGNRRTEHKFSQIPKATIPRSQFNRSHTHKTTFDSGLLIPIYVDEVLPGDTFNLNLTMFARLSTPTFPVMDNMTLDVFFFFVPYRLVWENWKKFCGEQDDPADSIAFTIPQITAAAGYSADTVFDYMGIPPLRTQSSVSALPFRSYNLIWNEWFRDQNLQDSLTVHKTDGPQTDSSYKNVQSRGKRHDYFTSCLPWPQKQTAGVELPLGTSAPVDLTITEHPSFNIGSASDQGLVRSGAVPNTAAAWEGGDPGAGGTTPAEWNKLGFTALSAETTPKCERTNSV